MVLDLDTDKKLLIELGNWQVCRLKTNELEEAFAVHLYCSQNNEEPVVFNWGWMVEDTSLDGIERCFRCRAIVPPEVVAIIIMLDDEHGETIV